MQQIFARASSHVTLEILEKIAQLLHQTPWHFQIISNSVFLINVHLTNVSLILSILRTNNV